MQMSNREICMNYKQAKNKFEQIQILADLNTVDRTNIIKILLFWGEKPYLSSKKAEKELHNRKYMDVLFKRLDTLDAEIAKREKEYREIVKILKEMR